ncbi:unnamed protein product [Ceratitis capitata]|uniref:(Mediterranean fruit fly) hypothetical protein n=1 Tax=Ceratitis capitata TaxID=7213 RepID=A0A811URR9_CERCA|nr:unnamed protein product [Ceratitis capitata]
MWRASQHRSTTTLFPQLRPYWRCAASTVDAIAMILIALIYFKLTHLKLNRTSKDAVYQPQQYRRAREKKDHATPHADHNEIISTPRAHLDHTYDTFSFTEPEHFNKESTHGGKTTKSLADSYELPYELGADVFLLITAAERTIGRTLNKW